jgi:hypothetical protein
MSLKPKPISIEQRIKDLIKSSPSQLDIIQEKEDKKNNKSLKSQQSNIKIDRPERPLPTYTISSVSAAGTNINR